MATILIVDDEQAIRSNLYDLFVEEHTCHLAETVKQALTYLDVTRYDAVLTDISSPDSPG